MKFADALMNAMAEHGLNQKETAELLEVSRFTIRNWIRGYYNPSPYNFNMACYKLNIKPSEIDGIWKVFKG